MKIDKEELDAAKRIKKIEVVPYESNFRDIALGKIL